MAKYSTGTAVGAGAAADLMSKIATALLANGWTAHDTISVDDVIYKGAALDATAGNAPFVRVTRTSTTAIDFRGYSDWDTTTHAGMNVVGNTTGSSRLTVQDASFTYFMRVNSVAIYICAKLGATYNQMYAGFTRRPMSLARLGMTKTTSLYAAGVTVMALASDMTTKWQVGQAVQIVNYAHASGNANAGNVELKVIQSITSNSVTFTAVTTKAYDSGALIGEHVLPICVSAGWTTTPATLLWTTAIDGTRTSATAHTALVAEITLGTDAPATNWGTYSPAAMSVISTSQGDRGLLYHVLFFRKGSAVVEDVVTEGTDTAVVLALGTNLSVAMGPQN